MKVPARELTSSPETPKSHSFTLPSLVMRIFEGLMSHVSTDGISRIIPRWMIFRSCR